MQPGLNLLGSSGDSVEMSQVIPPEEPVIRQLPPVIGRGWLQEILSPWYSAHCPFQLSGPKKTTQQRAIGACRWKPLSWLVLRG